MRQPLVTCITLYYFYFNYNKMSPCYIRTEIENTSHVTSKRKTNFENCHESSEKNIDRLLQPGINLKILDCSILTC